MIPRISQTPIHMLQRTQRLFIFLPVPGPSDDKSETQRNHTSLMNQPANEEQRSLAKMTTSPVTASNILEAPISWRLGVAGPKGRARDTSCQAKGTLGPLKASSRRVLSRQERVHSPPPPSNQPWKITDTPSQPLGWLSH